MRQKAALHLEHPFMRNRLLDVSNKKCCSNKLSHLTAIVSFLAGDISKMRTLLAWNPPISVDAGPRRSVQVFLNEMNV